MESLSKFFVRTHQTQPYNCFVIMPFDPELTVVYDLVIKPYVEQKGFICKRADEIYSSRTIMGDIWTAIQQAEIIIADMTKKSPNVMYELGLCHALWKKVILLTQEKDDVPFDLKSSRLIMYDSSLPGAERLKTELGRMLEALLQEEEVESTFVQFKRNVLRIFYLVF